MIRLLLVDEQLMVRQGVRALVEAESDIKVVGEASDLGSALNAEVNPDVILADVTIGSYTPKNVIGVLLQRFPESSILAVTNTCDPKEVRSCLANGAKGFLLKHAAGSQLIDALRRVASGEDYLQPDLGASIVRNREVVSASKGPTMPALTPKEQQVLQILALGHTNAEAAEILSLAVRTIEAHRAHIMEKLGVRSRAEMVRYAISRGLMETADETLETTLQRPAASAAAPAAISAENKKTG